jgi:superfamily II DNA or RNA helicase
MGGTFMMIDGRLVWKNGEKLVSKNGENVVSRAKSPAPAKKTKKTTTPPVSQPSELVSSPSGSAGRRLRLIENYNSNNDNDNYTPNANKYNYSRNNKNYKRMMKNNNNSNNNNDVNFIAIEKKPQRCEQQGKVLNPASGRCVNPPKPKATKKAKATCPEKPCAKGQVCNPSTGRCVKATSQLGKRLLKQTTPTSRGNSELENESNNSIINNFGMRPPSSSPSQISEPIVNPTCPEKPCAKGQVCNPSTGRCVKATGQLGKRLLKQTTPSAVSGAQNLLFLSSFKNNTSNNNTSNNNMATSAHRRKRVQNMTNQEKTQRCKQQGKVLNPTSGRCVNPPKPKATKKAKATCPEKPCAKGQVCNPSTGRCVKATSQLGKRLLKQTTPTLSNSGGNSELENKSNNSISLSISLSNSNSNSNSNSIGMPSSITSSSSLLISDWNSPSSSTTSIVNLTNNSTANSQSVGRPHIASDGLITKFGKFNLREHQVDACKVMLARPEKEGLLLYYDMGSGKTLTALAVGVNLIHAGQIDKVVCAVPKAVVGQFKEQLKQMELALNVASKFSFTTHDSVGKSNITSKTLLVIDEVHLFRSGEGPQFVAAMEATNSANKVLAMTGTPLVNAPSDIAAVIALINLKKTFRMVTHRIREMNENQLPPQYTSDPVGYVRRALLRMPKNSNLGGPEVAALNKAFASNFLLAGGINPETEDILKQYLKCTLLYYAPDKSNAAYLDLYPSTETRVVRVPMTYAQTQKYLKVVGKQEINPATGLPIREAYKSETRRLGTYMYPDGALPGKTLPGFLRQQKERKIRLHNIHVPETQHSPKLDEIMRTTQQYTNKGQKVVIYSVWTSEVLTLLRSMLRRAGITFRTIDGTGSAAAREDAKAKYNNDEIQVLLLSKAAGTGLDLKNTSAVMIVEPDWNEAAIQQAIARAVRAGSHDGVKVPRHVDIYRFVAVYNPNVTIPSGRASMTADEHLYTLSKEKMRHNTEMMKIMQQVSNDTVRCGGNSP